MADESVKVRAVESIRATITASERLREGLLNGENIGRTMIEAIESGVSVAHSTDASGQDASTLRSSMNDLLEEFQHARHKMRIAFMLPSIDDGMSISEIARTLGVSRQLAQRLVHEAREEERTHMLRHTAQ